MRESSNKDTLEPLALRRDGAALAIIFAKLDVAALAAIDDGPSARLLARWEAARSFTAEGSLEPGAVASFVDALTRELGSSPPRWWIDQLAAGKQRPGDEQGPLDYDVGLTEHGDRRGELVAGPGTTRVRPGVAMGLSESGGKLFFDLSMGRVEVGPLPADPDAHSSSPAPGPAAFSIMPTSAAALELFGFRCERSAPTAATAGRPRSADPIARSSAGSAT